MSDDKNTITAAKIVAADDSQAEQGRRAELSRQVLEQFTQKGSTYRFKDVPAVVAFTDHGDSLSTDLDNPDVAEAMTRLSESRGWVVIKASGSEPFYSTVERTQQAIIDDFHQAMPVPDDVQAKERARVQGEQAREDRGIAEAQAKIDSEVMDHSHVNGNGNEGYALPETQADKDRMAELGRSIRETAKRELESLEAADDEQRVSAAEREPTPKRASRLTNSVAAETVDDAANDSEQLRRQALAQSVHEQYRVAGAKYYFKDQAGSVNQLAFKDNGAKLSTSLNTERVTRSLVDLAESKGWTDIKVSGHKEFKRQIWRAATERGIEVRGYKPDAQDLATVSDKALNNAIEPVKSPEPATSPTKQAQPQENIFSETRNITGVVVEHGPAPYQNNAENKTSYYITIDTGNEQRTVWGVGLADAVTKASVEPGDRIQLKHKGGEPVTVKDNTGKIISSVRNSWTIQRDDKREVIAAVANAVAAQHVHSEADRQRIADGIQARMNAHNGPLPEIPMYDNNATTTVDVEPAKAKTKAPELIR